MRWTVKGKRGEENLTTPNHHSAIALYLVRHAKGVGYHDPREVAPGVGAAETTAGWVIVAKEDK